MIDEERNKREEDVEYISENEIQFKVILTEMNSDRMRYLVFNRAQGLI